MTYRTHKRYISYDQSNSKWSIVDTTSWVTEIARVIGCGALLAIGWYSVTFLAFM